MRNFKILFLKGEDLLFKNSSLHYPMDNLAEIIKSLHKFRAEVAGLVPATMMMELTGANQRSYEDAARGEADEDGEGQTAGKIFKPTISDLKLLIGTKDWTNVKDELGIDEDTPDHGAPEEDDEDDVEVMKSDHFDRDSASGGGGSYKPAFGASRDQSYSVFENPNQSSAAQLALKTVMQQMARKLDYDNAKIDLSNQSQLFGPELADIHGGYRQHFEDMRRQTMSLQQTQAHQLQATLKHGQNDDEAAAFREFDDSASEEESSEYEMSDIDSENCRAARGGLVLSRNDLDGLSNKQNNDEQSPRRYSE